jgi:hypothetical protein
MKTNHQRIGKVISILFLIIFIFLNSTACSLASDKATTNSRTRLEFSDKTETKTILAEIKQGMYKNSLHIRLHLDSGSCSWSLKDPKGKIFWQESLNGKTKFNEKRDLPLTPGKWQLDISLEKASGSYDIKWNGAK